MTEVKICEGGTAHGEKINLINLCVYGVPPSPIYKGGEGRPVGTPWRAPKSGILLGLQVLVGFHLKGERGKEGEGEGEGKGDAPFPCPIRTQGEVERGLPWPPLSLSTKAHRGPLVPPGFR